YWLVGADGGVFTYGDAGYFGSVPAVTTKKLAAPIVGVAATSDAKGYWLVGAGGGGFGVGGAGDFGAPPPPPRSSGWRPPRTPRATGSWAPTAACSASVTPGTSGPSRPST